MDNQNNDSTSDPSGLPTTPAPEPAPAPEAPVAPEVPTMGGVTTEQPQAAADEKCSTCGNQTMNCTCPPSAPAV